MTSRNNVIVLTVAGIALALGAGCTGSGRPSMLPSSDKDLRRTSAQFAADAAKRHPYKADAPRGGEAKARAQIGYMLDQIEIVNLSGEDWSDVEVWVNQTYVVNLPTMKPNDLKVLAFRMLYDDKGNNLPTSGLHIKKIEVMHGGKMYDVPMQLAD